MSFGSFNNVCALNAYGSLTTTTTTGTSASTNSVPVSSKALTAVTLTAWQYVLLRGRIWSEGSLEFESRLTRAGGEEGAEFLGWIF